MKKILMIESELQSCNTFLKCLQTAGFEVIVAENGFVAVHKAQSELPDLIISDIKMLEFDGYGILKLLREKTETAVIPLIFVTQRVSQAEMRKAMEMGADDYIAKSCKDEELLKAIAIRLERLAFLRQWYSQGLDC